MNQKRKPPAINEHEKISLLVKKSTDEDNNINNKLTNVKNFKISPSSAQHYNTNAYGEIKFSGSTKAKYIRIPSSVKATDMMQYLYSNDGFKIKRPKIILSIAGGAKKLNVPGSWKKDFKSGLIKAAKTADGWIFTGGLNTGVMRLVGDAVSEAISVDNVTVLGIATWGVVENNETLIRNEKPTSKKYVARYYQSNYEKIEDKQNFSLNPHHTHFILYDDNSKNEIGKETLFRANLEYECSKGKSLKEYQTSGKKTSEAIPIVLVVVRGGINTLKLIHLYLNKIPVVILSGTGGCASLIETAKLLTIEERNNLEKLGELVDVSGILETFRDKSSYKIEKDNAIRTLIDILKVEAFCITVCNLTRDVDLQSSILEALFKDNKNLVQNFKLELLWNKYQISLTESLQDKFASLKTQDLELLLEMALLENNYYFVDALLEKGINLENFLTLERFDKLYNSRRDTKNKDPLSLFLEKVFSDFSEESKIDSEILKKFFNAHIFEKFIPCFIPDTYCEENGITKVQYAEQNLFIWCVLFNQVEIAKLFWSIGENQIANALLAARIFKIFSKNITGFEKEFIDNFMLFEDLAIGVMNVFDTNTKDSMNSVLMENEVPFMKTDCLDFSVKCECKRFVALPSIQNIITKMWYRKLIHKTGTSFKFKFALCLLSFGLLAPFFIVNINDEKKQKKKSQSNNSKIYENDEYEPEFKQETDSLKEEVLETSNENKVQIFDEIKKVDTLIETDHNNKTIVTVSGSQNKTKDRDHKKKLNFSLYWKNVIHFYSTPMVLFVSNTIFYVLFLLMFSVTMLSKYHFDYTDEYYDSIKNKSFEKYDNESQWIKVFDTFQNFKMVSPFEIVVFIWVFAHFIEELKQLFVGENAYSLKQNLVIYFDNEWNILDALGCFLFLIGVTLRIISVFGLNNDVFVWSRIILSIDLSIWNIRALYFCLAFRIAGPKLLMIRKMVDDLKFFLIVIAIFMSAFAITVHSILYPSRFLNLTLIKRVVNLGYWTIFGEIFILDDLLAENDDSVDDSCKKATTLEPNGAFISSFILMIYMIISAVLLVNLVIAMFNSTYESVEENSDIHWKFQRYQLLYESKQFCYLPPPLNLLYYIIISPIGLCMNKFKKGQKKKDDSDEEQDEEREMIDEQKCAQKYLREIKTQIINSIDGRFDNIVEKLNNYEIKFIEMNNNRIELLKRIDESNDTNKKNNSKLETYEKKFSEMKSLYEKFQTELNQTNEMNKITLEKMITYENKVELLNSNQIRSFDKLKSLHVNDEIIQKKLDVQETKLDDVNTNRIQILSRIEKIENSNHRRFDEYQVEIKQVNENQKDLHSVVNEVLNSLKTVRKRTKSE